MLRVSIQNALTSDHIFFIQTYKQRTYRPWRRGIGS